MDKVLNEFRLRASEIPYNTPIRCQFILDTLSNLPQFNPDLAVYRRRYGSSYTFKHADGTVLSYHKALRAKLGHKTTKTNHYWQCAAARLAICPQIKRYREQNKVAKGMHIDHDRVDFIDLLQAWKEASGIEKIKLRRGRFGVVMGCRDQLKSWRDFHAANACLQAVTVERHKELTKARRQGRPPST